MKELKEAQMGIITVLALMLVSIKRRLPTRRFSPGITTLALAGIVLLVAAGSASANGVCVWGDIGSGEYYECGDLVTQSCTLNASMDCTDETLNGLIIGADGITIDGAGYSMTGDVVNASCVASQNGPCVTHSGVINTGGWDNVVVKNLEIKDFNTGVVIGTAGMGDTEENMTVTGCNIHDCGKSASVTHGIHLVGANYCTITKNEIHNIEGQGTGGGCGGGGNGIFMHGDTAQMSGIYGDYNNITCNYLHHNKKSGFFMKFQCMYCNISYNKATDNTQSGIMPKCEMSNHNTIEYNNMSDNGANGFYCGGDNNTVRHNTALNNGAAGIEFKSSADHNTVEHNFVCGHTTDISSGDPSNSGDYNTCDTGPGGWCDWSCGNGVAVYFDYDKDGQCSETWDDCQCAPPGIGSKCACCNPGLFDGSSAAMTAYENSCNRDCQFGTPGPDPNDCDFEITGIVKPDLIVANKSEAWFNDTHYYVSYQVQNIGNDTSNESVACVYINTVLQTGSNKTIGELAPDGTYSPVQTVGPFGPCTDPEDTIKVCADCDGNNTEWNETNNCLENKLSKNKPDLIITHKNEVWMDQAAGIYRINHMVCNIGTADAPASTTRVSIGGPPGDVPALAKGECQWVQIGNHTMTGDCDIITLFADGNNSGAGVIDELNETNNSITNTFCRNDLTIYVDPPSLNITPQDQFDINIKVDPAGIEVYGVEYYLTYSTSVLRAESQVKGPFLGTTGETIVVVNEIDRGAGIVSYAETRKASGSVITENISSVIQFTAIGAPADCTNLTLSGVIIVNTAGGQVSAIIENGTVCLTDNQAPVASGRSRHLHNNAQKKFECLAMLCSDSTDPDVGDPDAGGKIVYIRWSFGDGEYGTSEGLGTCPCKLHSYTSWIWEPFGDPNGDYVPFNASLTVTDNGDPQLEATTYIDVNVYLAGDANADGTVNILDAVLIGLTWDDECTGTDCCELLWTGEMADKADLNNDCKINILDAVIVGTMWDHNAYYPV